MVKESKMCLQIAKFHEYIKKSSNVLYAYRNKLFMNNKFFSNEFLQCNGERVFSNEKQCVKFTASYET